MENISEENLMGMLIKKQAYDTGKHTGGRVAIGNLSVKKPTSGNTKREGIGSLNVKVKNNG